ncbi:DNA helicase [Halanaeroarchaeum sulfurireducens]|uniref:DNA helicase n=1 Tax=Halanaeroarchaeum sulfurireducens TaxID=1604004 RepID=A0A0F7PEY2_9EURY|nr:DNA helicase [Halanaeroarchaeum sulfurireducens]
MYVNVRGPVTAVGAIRTVSTANGNREVADVSVVVDGEPTTVALWGSWAETAEYLEPEMELLVTDATERSDGGYATTSDSTVVVEPDFLVDVTDVRSWVQCPRMYYLNKLGGLPLKYPVTKGTIVHEVFGDLLRGRDLDEAVAERVDEAALEIGLLGRDRSEVEADVRANAAAIEGWLAQGTLDGEDAWRSEVTLISETVGIKGRADAIRRGMPVELKTGKNTNRSPRFQDKIQAASYALLLAERGVEPDTGTLLYTKNTAVDRSEFSGDLSPAKEFSIGPGLLDFVVRTRNEIAAMEHDASVPTGHEADAKCEYCFEQDTCKVVAGRLDQESKAGAVGSPLPAVEREYFASIYDAIEAERAAIHEEYRKLWTQTPDERADADRAVVDLEPAGREELPDGRYRLTARRPAPVTSKIREGDRVLASDGDPVSGRAEIARVTRLDVEVVEVTADEPVPLRRLDVYPSEFSVDRMLTALYDGLLRADRRRKDVLFDREDPAFGDESVRPVPNNEAQNAAVERAVAAEDFALIHGPPGTGKTYTIAALVEALVDRGERILLASFTNRAVDNALEAIRDRGVEDPIRVGTESGIRADMQDVRLDRSGDPAAQADALESASVVAATTATCGSRVLRSQTFDVVVVDEASQLTEPDALAAINRGDRFVLVGDHRQLPPVVQSEGPLSTSLFERLIDAHPAAAVMLDRQYRMSQRIQAFSSREFYDGALRPANATVAAQSLADLGVDAGRVPDGVSFHQVTGTQTAHTDAEEAAYVADLVDDYLDAGVSPADVGVIAPFRAQVAEIGRLLPSGVVVDTVDRFQGSSKEVVVVSFVATGSLDGPIFEDARRMNVALTRAKKALALVGDRHALAENDRYARMVEWADR